MRDIYNRKIDYLRISITDRCNLRCIYCMPKEGVKFIQHKNIMTYDEILHITKLSSELGIKKIKITGGEPLVRKDAIKLIKEIKNIEGIEQVTLTTNGVLLNNYLNDLKNIGIDGINISLDAIDSKTFEDITRFNNSNEVIDSIVNSANLGIKTKVNSLILPHINENEIINLALLAKNYKVHVRFIEVMPIGFGRNIKPIKPEYIKSIIESKFGTFIPYEKELGNGPAKYYRLNGFKGNIGFISAVSDCFCSSCNRVRLTSTGFLKLCLQYNYGIELLPLLRGNYTDESIKEAMGNIIYSKPKEHQFANKVKFVKDSNLALDCGFNPKLISELRHLIKDSDFEDKSMSSIGG